MSVREKGEGRESDGGREKGERDNGAAGMQAFALLYMHHTTTLQAHKATWGPFIPRSALNPSMGTCEVPVTNCSRRAKSSCTMLCTTAQNHEICARVVCVCAPHRIGSNPIVRTCLLILARHAICAMLWREQLSTEESSREVRELISNAQLASTTGDCKQSCYGSMQ